MNNPICSQETDELQLFQDSLQMLVDGESDSVRAAQYLKFTYAALSRFGNVELAVNYVDSAEWYSKDADNGMLLHTCYYYDGLIKRLIGQYEEALLSFDKYEAYFSEDSTRLLRVAWQKASAYQQLGRLEDALEMNLFILRKTIENKDSITMGNTFHSIGMIYNKLGNIEESIKYIRKSTYVYKQISSWSNLMGNYYDMGTLKHKLYEVDSARIYYLRALALRKKHGLVNRGTNYKVGLAFTYLDTEPAVAEKYFREAIVEEKKSLSNESFIEASRGLATSLELQGKNQEAFIQYKKGLVEALKGDNVYHQRTYYSRLHKLCKVLGKDKEAYAYLHSASVLSDSILSVESMEDMNALQVKYETSEKERKILENEQQLLNQNLELEQAGYYNGLLLIGLAALLLTSLFYYLFNRHNQKTKAKLTAQTLALEKEKVANLEKREKLLALEYMVLGQEEERQRIAQDLHDGLGGLLSTVKAHVGNIQGEVTALEQINVVQKTNDLVDHACEEVRRISHNMMPSSMRLGGVKQGVKEIIAQLRSVHGLEVDADISGLDQPLDDQVGVVLFRIIQELSNNIVKYAAAKTVTLQVNRFEDELNILVEDDGVGFDTKVAQEKEGMGLKSVESRVKYLNGSLDLVSTAEGTTVSINVPGVERD